MLEKIKKFKRVVLGKDFYYSPTKSINCKKFGSEYGGCWVATDNLDKEELVVFSFGLGEDITFDLEMTKHFECKVYGFDPTPKSIRYIESLQFNKNFKLIKCALSDTCGVLQFNLPDNENLVSGSLEKINSQNIIEVDSKDLQTICTELDIEKIDILKMDIEGSEYKVIRNMIENKIFPKQLLIEYHHFFDSISNNDTKESIRLLLDNGYELFHIDGYDYCFIQK